MSSTDLSPMLNNLALNDDAASSVLSLVSGDSGSSQDYRARSSKPNGTNGTSQAHANPTTPQAKQNPSYQAETADVQREINVLFNTIYEIQELRHSSSGSSSRLDSLLSNLENGLSNLQPRVTNLPSTSPKMSGSASKGSRKSDLEEIQADWARLLSQADVVRSEMREDGWLIRFRTTAEQASGMMDSLQKSLKECSAYVDMLGGPNSTSSSRFLSELEGMAKSHATMTGTYGPSIAKILRMMDKSITDRPIKNGESLRRLSELSSRWDMMQRQLTELRERTDLILGGDGPMEVLAPSNQTPGTPNDYFGNLSKRNHGNNGTASSSRSRNMSPSNTSTPSAVPTPSQRRSLAPTPSRTPSELAQRNISTTSRPPVSTPPTTRTPSNGRYRAVSPTPSAMSSFSNFSSVSRPGAHGSRIPIRSPPRSTFPPNQMTPPRSVPQSPYSPDMLLSPPNSIRNGRQTPDHSRIGASSARGGRIVSTGGIGLGGNPSSTPSSMGNRTVSASTAPRPRMSFGRAPPSSYRGGETTNSNNGTPSRPSSRISNISVFPSGPLIPWQPSKYDLLDQEVLRIQEEVNWNMLTSRLDPSLKKGQRRNENDEWKGEYVFGAGQKSTNVKLLKMNVLVNGKREVRYKVMGRLGGAWLDLGMILRKRMEQDQGIFD